MEQQYAGDERRSTLSQSIRACMRTELDKHEIKEMAWLEQHKKEDIAWLNEHELKDIAAHENVCNKLNGIAAKQDDIETLIHEVKSVWDGIGFIGKSIMAVAKFIGACVVILSAFWAFVHFGNPSK